MGVVLNPLLLRRKLLIFQDWFRAVQCSEAGPSSSKPDGILDDSSCRPVQRVEELLYGRLFFPSVDTQDSSILRISLITYNEATGTKNQIVLKCTI